METKVAKPKLTMVGALLCDTCPHRDECPEDFKEDYLSIRVIENDKTGECFGGYYCWGLPYNTIPFHQGIDWFWSYKYKSSVDPDDHTIKKLPHFPETEEDFILQ
ncbi:MAG TPA: hypothetical protein PL066_02670 [bacterium]|nr:hypothetical protein [bacterium]